MYTYIMYIYILYMYNSPQYLSCTKVYVYLGCGFPDISTRALVKKISLRYPALPVACVCDYNPFGLALLLTYKVVTTKER
jgi:DNA topoisomerase VI subunit A